MIAIASEESAGSQAQLKGTEAKARRVLRVSGVVLAWILAALGAVLIGAAGWICRTFGPISVDQMLLHLQGTEGVGGTAAETAYIESFVWQAVILPIGLVILLLALVLIFAGIRRLRESRMDRAEVGVLDPEGTWAGVKRWKISVWAPGVAAFVALTLGTTSFSQAIDLPRYVRAAVSPLSMNDYYVSPLAEQATAQATTLADSSDAPLNLVMIYLESIEDPLGDTALFEDSILEPVESRTSDWATISGMQQYSGGGWTMAGLVGMQCGVPLRGAGIGENDINSNEIGSDAAAFLPGAVCLGDVLNDAGYTSVFMGGADAQFASKERFLLDHGYDEVKDLRTWQAAGETEFSPWGLSDRALFENARAEILRLREAQEPFNLSLLSLDSHEPAHLFDYCEAQDDDPLIDAFRCSMKQVAGFLDFLEAEGFMEDTVVVLVGDHKKMLAEGGHMWDELSGLEERTLFNRFWSPVQPAEMRESQDQLVVFATTLDLLGLGRADGRAGVSVSAAAETPLEGSVAGLAAWEYEELIESRSVDLYERLWGHADAQQLQEAGAQ